MFDRGRAGYQQHIGSPMKQPRERDLHGRRVYGCCDRIQL
jgi:hypothetical protein